MADLFGEDEDAEGVVEQQEEQVQDVLDTEGNLGQQQEDALLMRFCPHDSSMLYPQVCC
jgi:hypothetical protein